MKILVTGGAGFIGSNFIELVLEQRPDNKVVCLDALTYAGNLDNLKPFEGRRFTFIQGSIASRVSVEKALTGFGPADAIVNFAAESHVDRSIDGAAEFVRTNVEGTLILLEEARKRCVGTFLQISTDEVYGALGDAVETDKAGKFVETMPLRPNNPYSATKAAADMMVLAFAHTYGMKVVITRSSNNYGPRQYPEKLIPLLISNAIANKEIPVYGDGLQIRDWLHVKDNCYGILYALEEGKSGEVYNLGGGNEWTNISIVNKVLEILGKPGSLIKFVKDRPGHDRRYAIDFTKAADDLGWTPYIKFEEGLKKTVEWYREHLELAD